MELMIDVYANDLWVDVEWVVLLRYEKLGSTVVVGWSILVVAWVPSRCGGLEGTEHDGPTDSGYEIVVIRSDIELGGSKSHMLFCLVVYAGLSAAFRLFVSLPGEDVAKTGCCAGKTSRRTENLKGNLSGWGLIELWFLHN
jgi:hypothetical protein